MLILTLKSVANEGHSENRFVSGVQFLGETPITGCLTLHINAFNVAGLSELDDVHGG